MNLQKSELPGALRSHVGPGGRQQHTSSREGRDLALAIDVFGDENVNAFRGFIHSVLPHDLLQRAAVSTVAGWMSTDNAGFARRSKNSHAGKRVLEVPLVLCSHASRLPALRRMLDKVKWSA